MTRAPVVALITPEHRFTFPLKSREDFPPRLALPAGARRPETSRVIATRNDLIQQAAALLSPDLRLGAAADHLSRIWTRYEATAWPRERHCTSCPTRRVGTLEGIGWSILQSHRIPSARHLRRIHASGHE
jgi:hypothetical protein